MYKYNYLKIALPVPLNTLFTYRFATNENLTGCRVLVTFGNNKRNLTGVVFEQFESDNSNNLNKIRDIVEVLDAKPVFDAKMLNFLQWISTYYISPIGETVKAAIPAGISPKTIMRILPVRETSEQAIQEIYRNNPTRYKIMDFLLNNTSAFTLEYLEKKLEINNIHYHITYLLERNLIAFEFQAKNIKSKIQKAIYLNDELMNDKEKLINTLNFLDKKSPKQSAIISFLLINNANINAPVLLTDIKLKIDTSLSVVNSLIKKKLINIVDIPVNRNARKSNIDKLATKNEAVLKLTDEQLFCVREIDAGMEGNSFKPYLLHGVTGSGKTLIYIHAIEKAISMGKSALLLVPEISLTPQLIDRFEIVFPQKISVFHSKMSDAERFDSWNAVHSGHSQIVIGARSALFAPLKNLGLIIVDEEHESSYKQSSPAPYYQARDCAMVRAKIENAAIILGSATPSMETYFNSEHGKIKRLEIKKRADKAELPKIKLIDMRSANTSGQVIHGFSRELIDKIKEKISRKEGVILLQNKRGFSNFIECKDCGAIPQCKHCSISLTFHQINQTLRCHYCGYTLKIIHICDVCGGTSLGRIGRGTQRIEEDLHSILASENVEANIVRLDLDTAGAKGAHRKILQQFANGGSDILIGTQMVAKGLDFDRVTLVGVINADIQLQLPDFRANERTFQLLSQVAGRAGRNSEKQGEVIIQTFQPHAYAINSVIKNDFIDFYNIEIAKRATSQFPPFTRFCVIEFSSLDEEKAMQHAQSFFSQLKHHQSLKFYLPQPPPIAKLNNRFRQQVVVKSDKSADAAGKYLRYVIASALEQYNKNTANSAVRIKIDIDSFSSF